MFKCPACSAPLEFQGGTIQKCGFCGGSVIVPSEVFGRAAAAKASPPPREAAPVGPIGMLAQGVENVRRLISEGKKLEAIRVFRETFGVSLAQAKAAVEAMERGHGVNVSDMRALGSHGKSRMPRRVKALLAVIFVVIFVLPIAFSFLPMLFFLIVPIAGETISSRPDTEKVGFSSDGRESDGSVEELLRFGGKGTGAGKFTDNRVVAVDAAGKIYSADYTGGRIQVFDAEGNFLTQWNVAGLTSISDLAAGRDGTVYIADGRGVRSFNGQTGKELRSIKLSTPRGVHVGADGRIYIAARNSIVITDKDLKIQKDLNKAAEDASARLGFEKIAVDGNGNIYAFVRPEGDLVKFSREGKFLTRIKTDVRSPQDIAIDPSGNIYLTNVSTIHVFNGDGKPLKTIKTNQAFGIDINDKGDIFAAVRPEVVKLRIDLE